MCVKAVRCSADESEFSVGEINGETDWGGLLGLNINAVVHLAAQVPFQKEVEGLLENPYFAANTQGTVNFARQCAEAKVRRFIFISTAKVLDLPLCDLDFEGLSSDRLDAYACSKWIAEQKLWEISSETGMEVVVLRPPLVYGPGVKGNFLNLMNAVNRCYPLPFGAINNSRSFVYVENLVDAIRLCLWHPAAAGQTFAVSDGSDVSSAELVRRLAIALDRTPILLNVPVGCLMWLGQLFGKQAAVSRLLGSLSLDISEIRTKLSWQPPFTMIQGLADTVAWYKKSRST